MSFPYPQVTIDSNSFNVYGDLNDAINYLTATITATAWFAANSLTQSQALVSSVRWLEQIMWLGKKTDENNALRWPRMDIYNVDPNSIPERLVEASFELAAMLVDTLDLQTTFQNPMPKSLGAGSAKVDYFRPVGQFGGTNVQILSPLPTICMNLVQAWIGGGLVPYVLGKGDRTRSLINRTDKYGLLHGF